MKTKETLQSISYHKNTNGGRILSEVMELLEDKKKNGFKIVTLLRGIDFEIGLLSLNTLQMREDSNGFIYAWLAIENNLNKPNQKQFKEFNSDLFRGYISKFSQKDQAEMLHFFICSYYQPLLEDTFETDTKFSLEVKSILKDLFYFIGNN